MDSPTRTSPEIGIHHPEFDRSVKSSVASQIANAQRISAPLDKSPEPIGGVLSVTLHQAIGLSAPDQHWEAFKTQQHKSVAQLKSDSRPWTGRSYQAHHKQYLPYAVLCFGQSRAFVASITGTTDSPVWAQDAVVWKFDIIRASQLSVHLYLKSPETNQRDTDIQIGVVTMDPLFEERGSASATEWLHVQGGTGQMRIGVSYDKKPLAQIGSAEEAYCSTGPNSPVTPLRKQDTQQLYALKSIEPELIGAAPTAPSSLRFQIDSPFIAPLAYACQSQRELHLLLPFVSGEHLFHRLQRDRLFDTDRSRFYAAEIFCALKHLHNFDIIYEGLRLQNILINSLGHITIVDHHLFLSDRVIEARAVDGASWYPAPEVLLSQAHYESSDWWRLGYILYEMLTGMPPFYSEDDDQALRNISLGALDLPGSLSPPARDMLSMLLHHNPGERLGANGPSEIEAHPFFNSIDWEKLERGEYEPHFKPRRVATIFRDQAPPSVSIGDMFTGFSYTEPGIQIDDLRAVQDESLPTPSATANPPYPATQTHAALDEDADWELVWEESPQTYILRDPRTNKTQNIPSRRQFYPNLNRQLTLLLRHGADPSFVAPSGTHAGARTALLRAVAKRNQPLVRLLLPRTHNSVLRTRALGLAVDLCDEEMVAVLLASAADGVRCDFDAADRPCLPRPYAGGGFVEEGCYAVDVSYPGEFLSPLVRAVRAGSAPLVKLLLSHGADANVGFHDLPRELSSEYEPPFRLSCGRVVQLAVSLGYGEIVRMLLGAGADVDLAQPDWRGHMCEMISRREYLEITAGSRAAVSVMGVTGA